MMTCKNGIHLNYPFEENWANDVMKLKQKYGLSMDDGFLETFCQKLCP